MAWVQEHGGANLYYHPYASLAGENVKYGVISMRHLKEDLGNWSTLYTSGRLHKPCLLVEQEESIQPLLRENLRFALRTALLLLPSKFTATELHETIASLSYSGDPRFAYGMESSSKICNIVGANPEAFHDLYQSALSDCDYVQVCYSHTEGQGQAYLQAGDTEAVVAITADLPLELRERLPARKDDIAEIHEKGEMATVIRQALGDIVAGSSQAQAFKGVLSAGLAKSAAYGLAKLKKGRAK